MTLAAGDRLGPYEIIRPLGAGGMGEVFSARDGRLGREVAVKVLPARFVDDPERRRRFEQEARATAALSHRNILAIFDVGTHDGCPYLVEELLRGESLRERLGRGAIREREAVAIAAAITAGLGAAHQAGIVHRDLKPENVFLTRDGEVKVLDFGLAKLLCPSDGGDLADASTLTGSSRAGAVLGTLGYMAPEQLRGQAVDARADLFALGCVLYEMLSGQRAFARGTGPDCVAAILHEEPPPLDGMAPRIPPALQAIVARCLAKRPEDRFDSARDLALALEAVTTEHALPATRAGRRFGGPAVAVAAVAVVVALALVATVLARRHGEAEWAREHGLPEIMRLVDAHDTWAAFLLARRVEAVAPDDPLLAQLWPQFAADIVWQVTPTGAAIFARDPADPEEEWVPLGESGETSLRTPTGCTVFRVEHPESDPLEFAMSLTYSQGTIPLVLRAAGEQPPGMVRVDPPGGDATDFPSLFAYGAGPLTSQIGSFLVDSHEVTNRQYKRFVDEGGYRRRELWREEIHDGERVLGWEEAMGRFRDGTGREGPATWELGSYPEDRADHPVTGVSWYEAAAFSELVGKRLPTSLHWKVASGSANGGCLIAGSNFSGRLAPVGAYRGGLNSRGLFDMAGNAREWCANAKGNRRVTRGGACNSPSDLFTEVDARPPLERDPTTGFRCMAPLMPPTVPDALDEPLPPPPGWNDVQPFSDEAWRTWQAFVAYPRSPLDARVEAVDESSPYWRRETVTFDGAYGGERMLAYLFLPRTAKPPYQTVVFWPGAGVWRFSSSDGGRSICDSGVWGYLVRDGRAVLYPILKGTYDRGGGAEGATPREQWVMQVKDVSRSLDYLETRDDVDPSRIGYLGFSWGAYMGTLACAADTRFKVAVLRCGGLNSSRGSDVLGWARRVRIPVQMVNGRFDSLFPFEDNSSVLFRALGTAEADKRQVLLPSDHQLSGQDREVMKVELEWFDRYLGPVRR